MRRLSLFLGSLSWGSRLQMIVVAIILGWWCWLDYQRKLLHFTIPVFLFAWFLGWITKSVLVTYARQTFRVWSFISIAILLTYFLAQNQRWWHTRLAHFGREFVLWLDLSCGYWFLSELRLRQMSNSNEIAHGDDGRDPNLAEFERTTQRTDDDRGDQHHIRF